MHYVMINRQNGELLILSHDDFATCDLCLDEEDNPLFTHLVIFSASYEKCLEYCEKRIGYKE